MPRMIGPILMLLLIAAAHPGQVTAQDRREVIANSARLLEQRYVDPAAGARLAARLRSAGRQWTGITDPEAFASAVTQWLRRESADGHLGLSYSKTPIPAHGGEGSFSESQMERWYGAHRNHGIEKIERLEGNVMLLELRVFPPSAMAGEVVAAAMNVVAQGDALIIDLRRNGGGADTAQLVMGYLLEGGSPLSGSYDRPSNTRRYVSSPHWVPGRRFGSAKPLYILTSPKTFSAAEAVAYNLQALKRAVIIGERTGGGAHPFEYRRVHAHFALDLPEGKSIHPITGGNWQGVGVKPDVEVAADQALDRALELAREAIAKGRSAAASGPRSLP
ncbi:MAG TPA: S41 family peptidase [Sphingomicrobium sp.]|nr:S41 family peptidase [Sphingomicrobium sp.]